MIYEFQVINSDQQIVCGEIEANSAQEASIRLRAQNMKVLDLSLKKKVKIQTYHYLSHQELMDFFSLYCYFKSNHISDDYIVDLIRNQSSSVNLRKSCLYIKSTLSDKKTIVHGIIESDSYFDPLIKHLLSLGSQSQVIEMSFIRKIVQHYDCILKYKIKLIDIEKRFYIGIGVLIYMIGIMHIFAANNKDLVTQMIPQKFWYFTGTLNSSPNSLAICYLAISIIILQLVRPKIQDHLYFVNIFTKFKNEYHQVKFISTLRFLIDQGISFQHAVNTLADMRETKQVAINMINFRSQTTHNQSFYTNLDLIRQTDVFDGSTLEVQSLLTDLENIYSRQMESKLQEIKTQMDGFYLSLGFILSVGMTMGLLIQIARGL